MTATVQIVVGQSDNTLKMPSQALRFRPAGFAGSDPKANGGQSTVWTLNDDGNAQPVNIRLGKNDGNSVQIISDGLVEGQNVVIGVATSHRRASWFGIRFGY
jgi:HlyD family secretion protein